MQNEENKVLGLPDVGAEMEGAPAEGLPMQEGSPIEPPKDKPKDTEAENEALKKMMFSPSASDADPTLELKEDKKKEDVKARELLKMLERNPKKSEKYRKELMDRALKDPRSVQIETSQGWMSVAEAIDLGFNFKTGKFDQEALKRPDWDKAISALSPREQENIRRLTKPGTGQARPRPLEGAAMEQPNPMLPQDEPVPETQVPGAEQGSPLQLGAM